MEKFRDIMKGEHPIDYGSEKCKWKINNIPKIENVPPSKVIISNLSGFRLIMRGESGLDYSMAKREWKLNNQ